MYLFVDSTFELVVGLLNKNFSFIEYQEVFEAKTSLVLQSKIHEILKQADTSLEELSGIIYCAGPGSYTGMRMSQGLIDILEGHGFKVYSFYHFQVPGFLGRKNWMWTSKAFKGEFFIYSKDGKESNHKLIKEQDALEQMATTNELYCSEDVASQLNGISTRKMLKESPKKIFSTIVSQNSKEPLYYYRPLNEEFNINV